MSLVGTRPILQDELRQYELHHRGKVLHASLAMGFDIGVVDLDGGVNKSGTFNYICRECDAKFFQDYENPDNIIHPPTDKFLAEIAVKNMLLQLSKRANEQELIPVLQRELPSFPLWHRMKADPSRITSAGPSRRNSSGVRQWWT